MLNERHMSVLYHATMANNLREILWSGVIQMSDAGRSPEDKEVNHGFRYFLSCMRLKYSGEYVRTSLFDVVIELDARRLIDTGKYRSVGVQVGSLHDENEERIISDLDLIPMNRENVKSIHVWLEGEVSGWRMGTERLLLDIEQACKGYRIPCYFYPEDKVMWFRAQKVNGAVIGGLLNRFDKRYKNTTGTFRNFVKDYSKW